jgi:transcriptional regulator with XRE-family HTH domain
MEFSHINGLGSIFGFFYVKNIYFSSKYKSKNVKKKFTNSIAFSIERPYTIDTIIKGGFQMSFDDLFEQRSLIAAKLKNCIREYGYTKVSFSKKVGISRPTLDKLLNGEIDNKSTFDKHLQKILSVLNLSPTELLFFEQTPKNIDVVYSQNTPSDYQMSEKAQKQYELLMDILELCEIYY